MGKNKETDKSATKKGSKIKEGADKKSKTILPPSKKKTGQ